MLCNGEACNYSSLLNEEGKLGNNWVRAVVSIAIVRITLVVSIAFIRRSCLTLTPHAIPHASRHPVDPNPNPTPDQVRAALLSVERSPNSRFDLEELFDLLDTHGK